MANIAGEVYGTGGTGAAGPAGSPGADGADGLDGDAGPPGLQGPQGVAGSNGSTGAQGPMGVAVYMEAEPGQDGDMGPPGIRGLDGAAGANGAQCPSAVFGDATNTASVVVGTVCYVRVPYSGTIVEWTLLANVACATVVDIWKQAGALPTNANTITASAKPTLTATTVGSSTTLTGWTTTVTTGDVLAFELESLSGGSPTEITLVLRIT